MLCVHGVGKQRRGETLDAWGGRLVEWLQDRLTCRKGELVILRSALKAGQFEDRAPAYARFTLNQDPELKRPSSEWIVAESWWADDFYPPPFRKLTAWLITSGSWIIVSHLSNLCVAHAERFLRILKRQVKQTSVSRWVWLPAIALGLLTIALMMIAAVMGTFLLVALMQFVVIALAILSAIPIPAVRSSIKATLLALQGVLGDSFVFTSNPLVRTGVLNRVQDDLRWLEERCDSVVVVAHSQGAAIAYESLLGYKNDKGGTSNQLRRLVTFGSGLLKLSELQASSRFGGVMSLMRFAVLAIPLYVVSAPVLWGAFVQGLMHLSLIPWNAQVPVLARVAPYLLMYPPCLLVMAFIDSLNRADTYRNAAQKQLAGLAFARFRWIDIFATHDPVPSGSIFKNQRLKGFKTRSVSNRMSMIADHTSYWDNGDEFVGLVARELDSVAGTGLFQRGDDKRLVRSIRARRKRVRCLRQCRLVVLLSVIVPVFLSWERLVDFGKAHIATLVAASGVESWPWPKAVRGVLTLPEHLTPNLSLLVHNFAYAALASSAIVAVAWGWYALMCAVWRSWDKSAAAESLQNKDELSLYGGRPAVMRLMAGIALYIAVRSTWSGGYEPILADVRGASQGALLVVDWAFTVDDVLESVALVVALAVGVVALVSYVRQKWSDRRAARRA